MENLLMAMAHYLTHPYLLKDGDKIHEAVNVSMHFKSTMIQKKKMSPINM